MAFADQFVPEITSCRLMLTAGSIIRLAPLGCLDDPVQYTLTLDTAVALNDVSISVTPTAAVPTAALAQISATNPVVLEAGRAVYFGANAYIVSQTTLITQTTTPTVVPIRPAGAATLVTVTAAVISSLGVLSTTNLSSQGATTTVEATDLRSGLQFATQQVGRELSIPLEWNARVDDQADWRIIHNADVKALEVFAHVYRSGGLHLFGRAQINNLNRNAPIKEVVRCTATLNFQPPYAEPTLYSFASVTEQAGITNVARLMGLVKIAN